MTIATSVTSGSHSAWESADILFSTISALNVEARSDGHIALRRRRKLLFLK